MLRRLTRFAVGADLFGGLKAGSSGFSHLNQLPVRVDGALYEMAGLTRETRRVFYLLTSAANCGTVTLTI